MCGIVFENWVLSCLGRDLVIATFPCRPACVLVLRQQHAGFQPWLFADLCCEASPGLLASDLFTFIHSLATSVYTCTVFLIGNIFAVSSSNRSKFDRSSNSKGLDLSSTLLKCASRNEMTLNRPLKERITGARTGRQAQMTPTSPSIVDQIIVSTQLQVVSVRLMSELTLTRMILHTIVLRYKLEDVSHSVRQWIVEGYTEEAVDSQNTKNQYGVETDPTRHRKIEAPDKRDWKHEDEKVDDNIWYVSPYEPSAIIETMTIGRFR